jgi:hypothetical protein
MNLLDGAVVRHETPAKESRACWRYVSARTAVLRILHSFSASAITYHGIKLDVN